MFSPFKKSLGLHLMDREAVLVVLKKRGKVTTIASAVKEEIPEGIMENGVIKDEARLTEILKKMKAQVPDGVLVCSLPSSKMYSAVVDFPKGMKAAELQRAILANANSVIPISMSDSIYQTSVLDNGNKDWVMTFNTAMEKSVFESYRKVLEQAGFRDRLFVSEGLALIRTIPLKYHQYPHVALLHSYGTRTLLTSVVEGRVFDGTLSIHLEKDLIALLEAYNQQIKTFPSHMIASGDFSNLEGMELKGLDGPEGAKPEFVSAEFAVNMEGQTLSSAELVVATGLALSYSWLKKKDGFFLVSLLD